MAEMSNESFIVGGRLINVESLLHALFITPSCLSILFAHIIMTLVGSACLKEIGLLISIIGEVEGAFDLHTMTDGPSIRWSDRTGRVGVDPNSPQSILKGSGQSILLLWIPTRMNLMPDYHVQHMYVTLENAHPLSISKNTLHAQLSCPPHVPHHQITINYVIIII